MKPLLSCAAAFAALALSFTAHAQTPATWEHVGNETIEMPFHGMQITSDRSIWRAVVTDDTGEPVQIEAILGKTSIGSTEKFFQVKRLCDHAATRITDHHYQFF